MKKVIYSGLLLFLFLWSCKDDDAPIISHPGGRDLTSIPYSPTPYTLTIPPGFPSMQIPAGNPMTVEGIELGRRLFYDPILSKDSTISCGSCHAPKNNFGDDKAISPGVGNLLGNRSSMPLANVGFFDNGLFWDGRSPNLEDQALHPVENPVEMAEIWDDVEVKLIRHPEYPERFRKAFGIEKSGEITKELTAKAIAQFERTMISANSRFDRKIYQKDPDPFLFSEMESEGYALYFDANGATANAGHCAHCHDGGPLLTSDGYFNNAIDQVNTLDDFVDKGLGGVTGQRVDNGKFRAPSLRNITLTAPYMHDGRFQTLEEVIDHYNSGGHYADNVQVASIMPLKLTPDQKKALRAFLDTFTDTSFINNPALQNPYQ